MDQDTLKIVEACRQCAAAASQCATAALVDHDASAKNRCAQLALDCAALCRLIVSTAQRDSAALPWLRQACSAICEELASECDQFDSIYCRRCAVVCRYTCGACGTFHSLNRVDDLPAAA